MENWRPDPIQIVQENERLSVIIANIATDLLDFYQNDFVHVQKHVFEYQFFTEYFEMPLKS